MHDTESKKGQGYRKKVIWYMIHILVDTLDLDEPLILVLNLLLRLLYSSLVQVLFEIYHSSSFQYERS